MWNPLRLLPILALSACPTGETTKDSSTTPTEPVHTGTDSDTNTDPDTRVAQTQSCIDYLVCLTAVGSDELDLQQQAYGPDGECWVDAITALACSQACEVGTLAEQLLTPTELACWAEGVPPTAVLFDAIGETWPVTSATGDAVCAEFVEWTVQLSGTADEELLATFGGSLGGYYPIEYAQACTLMPDAGISCVGIGDYSGWTIRFSADWRVLTLDIHHDDGFFGPFTCAVVADLDAVPEPTTITLEEGTLNPVAVGFELIATVTETGEFDPWFVSGAGYIPAMVLTFADQEFFDTGVSEGHICTAFAEFGTDAAYGGVSKYVDPAQLPVVDGVDLFEPSYEAALELYTLPANTDCDDLVDPKIWGEDAELLLEPFDGAHIGIGFGPMTTYLLDSWDVAATPQAELDAMLAMYVAINDASGDWVGDDWTTAIIWGIDPVTLDVLTDGGFLSEPVDVTGLSGGDALPVGQVRSYAYWYQDFFLMDLTNLKDGAP